MKIHPRRKYFNFIMLRGILTRNISKYLSKRTIQYVRFNYTATHVLY